MEKKQAEIADITPDGDANPDGPIVIVKDLYKAFGDKKILEGLTINLNKKENLIVMGKSGTGKSVLIKCIVRLILPDSGYIEVFGKDMDKMSRHELDEMRLRLGFLFQSGALYDSMTVRENMEFPLERQNPDMSQEDRGQGRRGCTRKCRLGPCDRCYAL